MVKKVKITMMEVKISVMEVANRVGTIPMTCAQDTYENGSAQWWLLNPFTFQMNYLPTERSDTEASEIFSLVLPVAAKRVDELHECLQINGPKDDIKHILDIDCGTGRATINIAKHLPIVHVIGIDPNRFAIERANQTKEEELAKNVEFIQIGAEAMPAKWTDTFDWVTGIQLLHDLPDPDESIKCVRRVLTSEGVLTVQDPTVHSNHKDNIGLPFPAAMVIVSCCCCLPSSLSNEPAVGNGIGREWKIQQNF